MGKAQESCFKVEFPAPRRNLLFFIKNTRTRFGDGVSLEYNLVIVNEMKVS